ncbi:hypothetical protein [Dethiobacter alkaliphilus]|uniref:Uncharacterized protein n=1 Tax=Dethiobacter alkaliphilus AHT 1 TaxID=555088 RepID=C0GJL9_DETAL|nr:hypothetical protein [Dethiobacter alkaliphilus]EEG76441.1 hypothetical protein DealDRAFT_2678 [Dethiobacter alkaliphilus AHT 1]
MTVQMWEQKDLQENIENLHGAIKEQQQLAEQALQQTLQKAAALQAQLQKIKAMHAQVLAMQEVLEEQGPRNNPQFLLEMVKQLANSVQEQQEDSQKQVTQALQLAVSALSESQGALSENRCFSQMAQMVKECEIMMQQNHTHQNHIH